MNILITFFYFQINNNNYEKMDKKILSKTYLTKDVLKKFNINRNQFDYLFNSGRLKKEDYQMYGRFVFTEEDMNKIASILDDIR